MFLLPVPPCDSREWTQGATGASEKNRNWSKVSKLCTLPYLLKRFPTGISTNVIDFHCLLWFFAYVHFSLTDATHQLPHKIKINRPSLYSSKHTKHLRSLTNAASNTHISSCARDTELWYLYWPIGNFYKLGLVFSFSYAASSALLCALQSFTFRSATLALPAGNVCSSESLNFPNSSVHARTFFQELSIVAMETFVACQSMTSYSRAGRTLIGCCVNCFTSAFITSEFFTAEHSFNSMHRFLFWYVVERHNSSSFTVCNCWICQRRAGISASVNSYEKPY